MKEWSIRCYTELNDKNLGQIKIGVWCNGNTTVFGTVTGGSIPSIPGLIAKLLLSFFYSFQHDNLQNRPRYPSGRSTLSLDAWNLAQKIWVKGAFTLIASSLFLFIKMFKNKISVIFFFLTLSAFLYFSAAF